MPYTHLAAAPTPAKSCSDKLTPSNDFRMNILNATRNSSRLWLFLDISCIITLVYVIFVRFVGEKMRFWLNICNFSPKYLHFSKIIPTFAPAHQPGCWRSYEAVWFFQAVFAFLLWQPVHDVLYQHVGRYHLILTDRIPPSLILFHLLLELMGKARNICYMS